jgi:serine protease Do
VFKILKGIASFIVKFALFCIFALAVLVAVFGGDEYSDTMPPIASDEADGRGFPSSPKSGERGETEGGETLPAPGPFDDRSIVETEIAKNWTSGSAFAIAGDSLWLTAKHVARGCDRLGIVNEDGSVAVKASVVFIAETADVAILRTNGGPRPMALDLDESDIKIGSRAFHVGYPQGKPGEVTSRLIGRELMVTEGAWRGKEDTLAWAETGRTKGLVGTLGGLSGGPAFDARGNIIGITIAENARRGRVITTGAASVSAALANASITPDGEPQGPVDQSNYTSLAKRLRTNLKVVQVICMVGD